jgi:hypothetical protein
MVTGGLSLLGAGFAGYHFLSPREDPLLPHIRPDIWWDARHFTTFLENLNPHQQRLILQCLEKADEPYDVVEIKKSVRWAASHSTTYPFRDKVAYHYHDEILKWVAGKFDIPDEVRYGLPSLLLEKKILEAVVGELWKDLSDDQRRKVLAKAELDDDLSRMLGGASALGAAGIGALAATIHLNGFAFYTTMSSLIHATAGVVGITVPFTGYMAASSTAALVAGPVGWTVLALAGLASVFFLGRADHMKAAAFAIQMHLIKIQALEDSKQLPSVMKTLEARFKA